jgi:hypothetical protein
LVPFYENEVEEESEASSEDEDIENPRWCTVRSATHINGYGDAAAYIGMAFSKKEHGDTAGGLTAGVIQSVVKKHNRLNGSQHFKLVDSNKRVEFVPCKIIMSTAKSNVYKVCSCVTTYLIFIFSLCFSTS